MKLKKTIIMAAALTAMTASTVVAGEDEPQFIKTNASPKTVKLMAIGNSFSRDALTQLPFIVKTEGHSLVYENAIILGGSLEDHVRGLEAFETNGPAHLATPYGKRSLKELLRKEKWDIVTIQQASPKSFKPETFEPYAGRLVEYIHQNAPDAEIVVHQTWAWRDDHRAFTNEVFTADDMYTLLKKAYAGLAEKYSLRQIRSGDAFQAAKLSPDWGKFQPDPDFDWEKAEHPALPVKERFALHRNGYWIQDRKKGSVLVQDAIHANSAGHYLLGCVWYQFLFEEPVPEDGYQSPYVDPEEAKVMRKIARSIYE